MTNKEFINAVTECGDAVITYRSTNSRKLKYNVCTLDFNNKYIPRAGESGGQIELNYLTNYRIIRYSDVLLMAAEANNRGGINDDLALGYLNQVRIRAFDDDEFELNNLTGSNLTEAIWEERKFELAMEGHRFFDLVRTNQASSVIPGFVEGKHEVFPIPQQEVDISGLTQNPGY